MTELEFKALAAQGYNRIPLVAETYADLDTPLALYLKLAHVGVKGGAASAGPSQASDPPRGDGAKRQGGAFTCLMESVVGGERFGRYSFIGLPARTVIRASGTSTEVLTDGVVQETHQGDPLAFIEEFQKRFKVAVRPGMPRFCGGLAGYFGYDTVRHMEPRLGPAVKPFPAGMEEGIPDLLLMQVDELVIVDNLAGRIYLMVYADPARPESYSRAQQRLLDLRIQLRKPADIPYSHASMVTQERRDFEKADYLAAVRRAKEYIMAGDLMQVQVGQVITKPFRDAPLSLYRALRSLNPSPYMYFWNFGDFHVVGASPEILVRQESITHQGEPRSDVSPLGATRRPPEGDCELGAARRSDASPLGAARRPPEGDCALGAARRSDASPLGAARRPPEGDCALGAARRSQITIRPLAGTRKRGATPEQDAALAAELQADPKEIAEHVMLIDLARNDVGRVSEPGTVKVTDTMAIERYSHVMHLVSNVAGTLKPGMSNMDVLRASFPAGTLTGAPKVRAMELIDELEPVRRGLYGGAAGYLSYGGEMDLAIAIRTGVIKNGTLYVQAAAGIVADSNPEAEWAETEAKARAVLRAAEQVQHGLDAPI